MQRSRLACLCKKDLPLQDLQCESGLTIQQYAEMFNLKVDIKEFINSAEKIANDTKGNTVLSIQDVPE